MDSTTGKMFLKHEYNRDGESYRSPWSNQYFPTADSSFFPSAPLLQLEQKANNMFATYVKLYYDSGTYSSVYFVDTDEPGFNACFLVKKDINDEKDIKKGCWDAIHVVTCSTKKAGQASYRVISTVMITIEAVNPLVGNFAISGSCAKTTEQTVNMPAAGGKVDLDHFHIKTIGKIIENNEGELRNDVVENYINKQRQITNTARMLEEYMTRE
jgi:capping protein (actin filament) muscle Z-line, beta